MQLWLLYDLPLLMRCLGAFPLHSAASLPPVHLHLRPLTNDITVCVEELPSSTAEEPSSFPEVMMSSLLLALDSEAQAVTFFFF